MSSTPNSVIGAALSAESDPIQLLLEQAERAVDEHTADDSFDDPMNDGVSSRPSSPINDGSFPPPLPSNPAASLHTVGGLAGLANILKNGKNLKPKSVAELDIFINAASVEEQMLLLFTLGLECRDLMEDVTKPAVRASSDGLKKNIALYSKVFLLSSATRSYKGDNSAYILKAMRELNVADLPGEKEKVHIASLLTEIGNRLTTHRNAMKSKLKESVAEGSSIANVADLTQELISGTAMKHSLELYMRVAYLRWCYVKFIDNSDFWGKVDESIGTILAKPNEAVRRQTFYLIYQDDIKKYGSPAACNYELSSDVEDFFKTIDKHAGGAKSKKRKLVK